MSDNTTPSQESYKPLKPFQLFIKSNFPFIEATFEALDNYGLYCKIVEYLNDVISNENSLEDNMTNLYNYVINYFDNLDLTNEVTNIIQEMVSDGTITDIISNYIDPYITEYNGRITTIENQVNSYNQGVNGVYASVDDLETADPDHSKIYVVSATGHWYYYANDEWNDGGVFQSSTVLTDKTLSLIDTPADSNATGINIKSIKNELEKGYYNILDFDDWANGNILSNGSDGASDTTSYPFSIKSVGYTQITVGDCLIKPNGFYVMIFEYNNDYSLNQRTNWLTTDTIYSFDSTKLYRIDISDYTSHQSSSLLWKDTVEILKQVNSNIVYPKFITVGTGKQYTTLKSAIDSISDASKNNPYNILIYPGTYNALEGFELSSQSSSFEGLTIPDYVNLIGIGTNSDIIIQASLPADISSYSFPRDGVSTINVCKNSIIKNLTIKAKNMRYAIHNDDFKTRAVADCVESFEDLIVIYENNDQGVTSVSVPMGIGAYNGRKTTIKNCKFTGEMEKGHTLLIHNNVDSPNRCYWEIENCRFNGNLYSIGLSSAGSNQLDQVVLKGCKLEKNIRYSKQGSYQGSTNEFYLTGYGDIIPGYSYSNITEDLTKIDLITY